MKFKKYLASFMIGLTFLTSFTGCQLPKLGALSGGETTEISYIPYKNKATTTNEIVEYITIAMEDNQSSCEIFVPNEDLIDANLWLNKLSGIEQIQVEYLRVKDGYNMVVSFDCWDNYAIMKAYNDNDTSSLNERQLVLFNKYIEILKQVTKSTNSDYENELAIHDYLVANIEYVDNEGSIFNAYDALINGQAVCSGYTECFKTFMDMLGIENYTLSGTAGTQQHIWNVVKLGNEWYQVDVTWDDPVGSESSYIDHAYFNITDEDMRLDHSWTSELTTEFPATGTTYSYINQENITIVDSQYELDSLLYRTIRSRKDHIVLCMTDDFDLKSAVSGAGIQLGYYYKPTKRAEYTLYSITFNYH